LDTSLETALSNLILQSPAAVSFAHEHKAHTPLDVRDRGCSFDEVAVSLFAAEMSHGTDNNRLLEGVLLAEVFPGIIPQVQPFVHHADAPGRHTALFELTPDAVGDGYDAIDTPVVFQARDRIAPQGEIHTAKNKARLNPNEPRGQAPNKDRPRRVERDDVRAYLSHQSQEAPEPNEFVPEVKRMYVYADGARLLLQQSAGEAGEMHLMTPLQKAFQQGQELVLPAPPNTFGIDEQERNHND